MAENTEVPPSTPARFFTWMRSLNIQREPGWIGGVAAGVATRLGIDPLIVRGILVVVAILGAPVLLVYAAAWLLLPDLDDKIHLEQVIKGNLESAIAGIGVLVLLSLLPVSHGIWFAGGWGEGWGDGFWGAAIGNATWILVLLSLAVWLVVWIARRPGSLPTDTAGPAPTPPAANAPASEFAAWRTQQAEWKAENVAYRQEQNTARAAALHAQHLEQRAAIAAQAAKTREQYRQSRPNSLFTVLVIGLALVAVGLTALWAGGGELDSDALVASLAAGLAVLAVGMMINGILGKRPGGASGLAWIIVVTLIVVAAFPQSIHVQYAQRTTWAPVEQMQLVPDIFIASGGNVDMNLEDYYESSDDLFAGTKGNVDVDEDHVFLFVWSGDVTVELPAHAKTAIEARAPNGGVRAGQPLEDVAFEDQGTRYSASFEPELYYDANDKVVLHVFVLDGTITVSTPKVNN